MKWFYKVYYKDFADGWVLVLMSTHYRPARDQAKLWNEKGHATRIEWTQ